jgi:arsenite methyltransferase
MLVASNLGYPVSNVEFRNGLAEAMPVEDGCVDLIISNCVINLAPEKPKVFREMFRVLRPGGRFTISEIVSDQPVPNYLVHDAEKWGNCLSAALQVGDYITKPRWWRPAFLASISSKPSPGRSSMASTSCLLR